MRVAVVLIAKNRAENVGRLIESVLDEQSSISEIVIIDSASRDVTVERAAHYPIRILRLDASRTVRPADGRYTGFHAMDRDTVLFTDGDMELSRLARGGCTCAPFP
jgi:glycosyltransferase involved in cell wall biosynthesis